MTASTQNKHIAIIGCGSLGLYYAAKCIDTGQTVELYENNPETIAALQDGFSIIENDNTIHYPHSAQPDLHQLHRCNIIFLFVKSYSTKNAICNIRPYISNNAIIVTLQNGIGNTEIIKSHCSNIVVSGTTAIGAAKQNLNNVKAGGIGPTVIGGSDEHAIETVFNLLHSCKLPVKKTGSINNSIWEKAIINAAINPIAAILQIPNGALLENPYAIDLQQGVIAEAVTMAAFLDLHFDKDILFKKVQSVCKKTSNNICSMQQDLQHKRRTEIDTINGKFIEIAKTNNVQLQYNSILYNIIKAKELNY